VRHELDCIIAIYNKLDKDSPYRSDIFDLFGTPDSLNIGLVGTKDGHKFKSLYWDWGLNGIKKVCKFLYWQQNQNLDGFERWYRRLDFKILPKMIDKLFYVLKYQDKKVTAFIATINRTEKRGGRLWFDFTPQKFVLLPPDFMADYRRDFFSHGREDSQKWSAFFESEYSMSGLESMLGDIFSSAASQDQYHIIPVKYIDKWVEKRTDPGITTKPLFISSVADNKKLLARDLPSTNQVFWSIFSQYTGHTQVTGSFSIIVKGSEYSVTDIPVNSFIEKGYVYYHEVGVPYAIFQVLQETLEEKAYRSFKENQFLKIEFYSKKSIGFHESHFLKKAERVSDIATTFNTKYKLTDYDYVLHLSPLGLKHKIAFDLTSGLWYKGFGRSKPDFVQQWLHNLTYVPLNNPDIIAVWHYGLVNFEPFEGFEIGLWLIKNSGLRPNQYLYLDKAALSQGNIFIPDDIRLILLPLYDDNIDFLNLKSELTSLNPGQNIDKLKASGFYKMTNKLIGHLLK
jgi:hypothetical protein